MENKSVNNKISVSDRQKLFKELAEKHSWAPIILIILRLCVPPEKYVFLRYFSEMLEGIELDFNKNPLNATLEKHLGYTASALTREKFLESEHFGLAKYRGGKAISYHDLEYVWPKLKTWGIVEGKMPAYPFRNTLDKIRELKKNISEIQKKLNEEQKKELGWYTKEEAQKNRDKFLRENVIGTLNGNESNRIFSVYRLSESGIEKCADCVKKLNELEQDIFQKALEANLRKGGI